MSVFKKWLDTKSPKFRRNLTILVGALALIILLYIIISESENKKPESIRKDPLVRNVLTDKDTRNISVESLSAELKLAKKELHDLKRELTHTQQELKVAKDMNSGLSPLVQNQITSLLQKQEELKIQLEFLKSQTPSSKNTNENEVFINSSLQNNGEQRPRNIDDRVNDELGSLSQVFDKNQNNDMTHNQGVFDKNNIRREALSNQGSASLLNKEANSGNRTGKIKTITDDFQVDYEDDNEKIQQEMVYIPSGSIISATFLNGIDAPTGQGARREPFPITLKVDYEAILPNHFTADIQDCFLMVSGYGDISSERAMLRGEKLSCIRSDGGVIETNLDAYVVGEDGKAGVKGKLVSKQGQVIARSLLVGSLSGLMEVANNKTNLSGLFSGGNVNETNATNKAGIGSTFGTIASRGAGSALEKITDYYMQMADGIFPVIEILAGREVDLILTNGAQLRLRQSPSKS